MKVYVLYKYYDYNRMNIYKVVSSFDDVESWLEESGENFYEDFVVDE